MWMVKHNKRVGPHWNAAVQYVIYRSVKLTAVKKAFRRTWLFYGTYLTSAYYASQSQRPLCAHQTAIHSCVIIMIIVDEDIGLY